MEAPEYTSLLVVLLLYACWMFVHSALLLFPKKKAFKNTSYIPISVIIPFRNEGQHLVEICSQILNSSSSFKSELILVDDHSENNLAAELSDKYSQHANFKLLRLTDGNFGKKAALTLAHAHAGNAWIVHLDADVTLPENWLKNISALLAEKNPGIIALPVFPDRSSSLLNKFETLEFIAVMTVTEAGFIMRHPTMANGAHLAVHKDAFHDAGAYKNDTLSSGDDLFLLHKIAAKKKWECTFEFRDDLLVKFPANNSLKSFFNQRIRWLSKSRHYKNPLLIISALLVGIANLVTIYSLIRFVYTANVYWLLPLLLKAITDFIHLIPGAIQYKRAKILPYQLLLSLLYPLYTFILIFASFVYRPDWKGRKIN